MIVKELCTLFMLFAFACYVFECSVVTTKLSKIVRTQHGQLRGALCEFPGTNLKPVEAFKDLEYASTYVRGPVRFMPPQSPAEYWKGNIRVVYAYKSVCPQKLMNEEEMLKTKPEGEVERMKRLSSYTMSQNEECLRLNVYMPAGPSEGRNEALLMAISTTYIGWFNS